MESEINWRDACQAALVERRQLTTNPLITGEELDFAFEEIYVPLGLVEWQKKVRRESEISLEPGSPLDEAQAYEITHTFKHDEFFEQVLHRGESSKSKGRRLGIIGEPGTGKTTLLQKIADWVFASTQGDVAIWVSLADLQGRSLSDYLLQKWLKDTLQVEQVTPEIENTLVELFNSDRVWLLLDGVDEIGTSIGNPLGAIASQITGWLAAARIVLTCRLNIWDAGKNALFSFDVYRNLDFDYPQQVGQFINCWFKNRLELGQRLIAELDRVGFERIRDTVRNPLRLALLCRIWQTRQGSLPETKAALYEQFAGELYEWKQEVFPTTSQQRRELNAMLGRLALQGLEQSESRFQLSDCLVREVFEQNTLLLQLVMQLGWLNLVGVVSEDPSEQVYAFYHPTFHEYFAALAIDDWHYFLDCVPSNPSEGIYRIFEPKWKEVILLWLGREDIAKEEKEAFLQALIEFEDGCLDFYQKRAYFLAAACITEFKDCSNADRILANLIKWSFGYFNDETQEWGGWFTSFTYSSRAALKETNRSQAVRQLSQFIISEISNSKNWKNGGGVFGRCLGEAAGILGEIDPNNQVAITTLVWLLEKAQQAKDETTTKVIANTLGRITPGNQTAIATLINLLNTAKDDSTRHRVADSLGRVDPGNQTAITTLVTLLEIAENRHVRISCAHSLGDIATGNEMAISSLVRLIELTKDEFTRQASVTNLGYIGSDNDLAVSTLVQLIKTTKNQLTCRYTAWALGNIAINNKIAIDTINQLIDTTQNDTTRISAAKSLWQMNAGNETALSTIVRLLQTSQDSSVGEDAAEILAEIEPGNEAAINQLIKVIQKSQSSATGWRAVYALTNFLRKEQCEKLVTELKRGLSDWFKEIEKHLYYKSYHVIWSCAQNMTYPDFYQAWQSQPTSSERVTMSEERVNADTSDPSFFTRCTDKVMKAIMLAEEEARRFSHRYVKPEHILLGLIAEGTNIAAKILKNQAIKLKKVRFEVEKIVSPGLGSAPNKIPLNQQAKQVFELASEAAEQLGHVNIDTTHILLALIRQRDRATIKVLENLGVDLNQLETQIIRMTANKEGNAISHASELIDRNYMQDTTSLASSQLNFNNYSLKFTLITGAIAAIVVLTAIGLRILVPKPSIPENPLPPPIEEQDNTK